MESPRLAPVGPDGAAKVLAAVLEQRSMTSVKLEDTGETGGGSDPVFER